MATLTTPRRGYPYPDGAERVMDGDNAIAALAGAVDADVGKLWTPPGAVVSGPLYTQSTSTATLPLDSFLEGSGVVFDNANDQIVIPAGLQGLYHVYAWGTGQCSTAGGHIVAAIMCGVNGGGVSYYAMQKVYTTSANPVGDWSLSTVINVAPGYVLKLWGAATVNLWGTWQVKRFGCVRVGSAYGSGALRELVDELGPDAKPAELEP